MLKIINKLIFSPARFFDKVDFNNLKTPFTIFIVAYTFHALIGAHLMKSLFSPHFPIVTFAKIYLGFLLWLLLVPVIIWCLSYRKHFKEFFAIYLYSQLGLVFPMYIGLLTLLLNIRIIKAGMSGFKGAGKRFAFWIFYCLFYWGSLVALMSVSQFYLGSIYNKEGNKALSNNNLQKALHYYNLAVEDDELFSLHKRAYVNYKLGNKEQAIKDLKEFLENSKSTGYFIGNKIRMQGYSDMPRDSKTPPDGTHIIYKDEAMTIPKYEFTMKDGHTDGLATYYITPDGKSRETFEFKNDKTTGLYRKSTQDILVFELVMKGPEIVDINYLYNSYGKL